MLFDFDGTLTEPGSIDFAAIRAAIQCPSHTPILEYIQGLPSPEARRETSEILEQFETEAAARSGPNSGAEELLQFLIERKIHLGILTRNSLRSVHQALKNFKVVLASDFAVIVSRDHPWKPKPSPEGILAAARQFGVPAKEILVVGDFVFDMQAGHDAGAHTVFLSNGDELPAFQHPPNFTIHQLDELKDLILKFM